MGTEAIFGTWDGISLTSERDELAALWHILAAQNVGTSEFQPNLGLSQRRHEIVMLWELYRRARPGIVVEIGVAQGGTFASWCILGRDDATIIGIDRDVNDCRPRRGEPVHPSIYNGILNMTTDGGGMRSLKQRDQLVVPIEGWSFDDAVLSQLRGELGGRGIDFLFHDASHSAEMFARDFQIFWPLMSEDGVFAVHDVMPSQVPECNKSVEWNRIKSEENYSAVYEFFSSRTSDSMGIGVLIR